MMISHYIATHSSVIASAQYTAASVYLEVFATGNVIRELQS